MVRTDRTDRLGQGGMEGPTLPGNRSGAPPLSIEVRRVEVSGGCHQFYRCCRGRGLFLSVQQNNHNTLHTNPNCFLVQDSTKSAYDKILLWTTTNRTNNENLPRKNSQKNSDTKIEDSQPYIAELVENMPKYRISGEIYRSIDVGGLDSYYVNTLSI